MTLSHGRGRGPKRQLWEGEGGSDLTRLAALGTLSHGRGVSMVAAHKSLS
jgi:hypothetical protein